MGDPLQHHLDEARRRSREAEQKAEGGGRISPAEAAIRGALDYSIDPGCRELEQLDRELGEEVDAGSFLIGMMAATFALQGMSFFEVLRLPAYGAPLFREYMAKARAEKERLSS